MAAMVARWLIKVIPLYPIASRFHANQVTGSGRRERSSLAAESFVGELANGGAKRSWEGGFGGKPGRHGKTGCRGGCHGEAQKSAFSCIGRLAGIGWRWMAEES